MRHLRQSVFFVVAAWIVGNANSLRGAETPDNKPVWLAVGKQELVGPLTPLVTKRQEDGYTTIVSVESVEQALAHVPRRPAFLLLVGDDEPHRDDQPWYLPAQRRKLYRWRDAQRHEYASDSLWGDLNDDLIPDIPVGRIPARSPEQVSQFVEKILAYENRPPDASDLRMAGWLGSPSYGAALDTMATRFGMVMFRNKAPSWLSPWIVTGNASEDLCGVPSEQPAVFSQQLRRGGLFSMLAGHGTSRAFYSMKTDGRWVVYTADLAAGALSDGPPAPPMFVFSCEVGDFTGAEPCLAESLLFLPGGPVATVAATTESHPLTNYFSGTCLFQAMGAGDRRLGDLWLKAQRGAMTARDFLMEMTLRDVEGKLEDPINVGLLRRDQVLMYALLGDPATRLRLPQPLDVSVTRTDNGWQWQAEQPPGATRLEIGFRTAPPMEVELKARPSEPDEARAAFQAANAQFRFEPAGKLPDAAPWEGVVNRTGWLRLVAVGEKELHVAVVKLE